MADLSFAITISEIVLFYSISFALVVVSLLVILLIMILARLLQLLLNIKNITEDAYRRIKILNIKSLLAWLFGKAD